MVTQSSSLGFKENLLVTVGHAPGGEWSLVQAV